VISTANSPARRETAAAKVKKIDERFERRRGSRDQYVWER